MKNTIPLTYPEKFAGLNLDAVNELLARGVASKADAEQLVEWWNRSGKRFTVAKLGERCGPLYRHGPLVSFPVVTISND
jgi:hypothetical protein